MPRRITKGLSSVRRNGGRRGDAGNGLHAATGRVKAKFPTLDYRCVCLVDDPRRLQFHYRWDKIHGKMQGVYLKRGEIYELPLPDRSSEPSTSS